MMEKKGQKMGKNPNPFNPKLPMLMKSRSEKDLERRLAEAVNRGHEVISRGKSSENGTTIYWAKINKKGVNHNENI